MRSNRDVVSLNASTLDISRSLPFSTFALKAWPLDRSPREPVHFESNHLSGDSLNMHFKETPNWLKVMAPEAQVIIAYEYTYDSSLKTNNVEKIGKIYFREVRHNLQSIRKFVSANHIMYFDI